MADLIESARAILSVSERRMEATANNVANMTAPGYKSQKLYSDVLSEAGTLAPSSSEIVHADLSQGKINRTGNTIDIAIGAAGFFALRGNDGVTTYSRQGQFRLDSDGRLVNGQGLAVLGADGGDIRLPTPDVAIQADGTMTIAGINVAKVGLFQPAAGVTPAAMGGSLFAMTDVEPVSDPQLHQGMVEASNVALADEMVALMEAMRNAEGGARMVQVYDDLMGKAINTFGQR